MNDTRKFLYLVRHAKSSWDDASLADRDRPLNGRGRRNAPEMGRRMAAQGHRPDLIVSSPANRALSTARAIAAEVGVDEADIVIENDLYFAGTAGMMRVLEEIDDRHDRVMMVGHNPVMTDFMNHLSGAGVFNMPTGAVAVIAFGTDSWAQVAGDGGELLGYDYPKGPGDFGD